MHARYPLRKTFYREAPGGDKARMSGATAQKVRRAKELEGGEGGTGKIRHGKWVGHVVPSLEQPMPPPSRHLQIFHNAHSPSHRTKAVQSTGMQAWGVGKGRIKSLVRVGPASG